MKTSSILLVAVNARYSHTGLGARFLMANMGELRPRTRLFECNINESAEEICNRISALQPAIIGLGVYIWNRCLIETLIPSLRRRLPAVKIVLGGPEITYDTPSTLAQSADCVICGEGELRWPEVCRRLITGTPVPWMHTPEPPALTAVTMPDTEYTDEDIRHKNIYIEASRGCPFACDFCLSALDAGVRNFPEEKVHAALQRLLDRGCLQFRFVDRSFNLGGARAQRLLTLFHEQLQPGMRLHFEMTPDGLTPALRAGILRFPPGVLHIETGVQSFNTEVLRRVGRQCDSEAVAEGITWLTHTARAKVHADLIAGLPGETLAEFTAGFNRLFKLGPAEIQIGVLKLLHGAPLKRHIIPYGMRFRENPPYDVLETTTITAEQLDDVRRFAAHWERIINRGHFPSATARMLRDADSPWRCFDAFSRLLAGRGGLYGIVLETAAAILLEFLACHTGLPEEDARALLRQDYLHSGRRIHLPAFLRPR